MKRPIELCNTNEDSRRHLRASLGYLESRLACPVASNCLQAAACVAPATTQSANNPNAPIQAASNAASSTSLTALQQADSTGTMLDNLNSGGANQVRFRRPANYFKRVTSAAANCEPAGQRRQTRNVSVVVAFTRHHLNIPSTIHLFDLKLSLIHSVVLSLTRSFIERILFEGQATK